MRMAPGKPWNHGRYILWRNYRYEHHLANRHLGRGPGRRLYSLHLTHPGGSSGTGAFHAAPIAAPLAAFTQQRTAQLSDAAQHDLCRGTRPGGVDRSLHSLWLERGLHPICQFLPDSVDGFRDCGIIPGHRHRHQHLAAPAHWLHLVAAPPCPDAGRLCPRHRPLDWHRK